MKLLSTAIILATSSAAWAVECPTPGEPCKIVILSPQEEKALTGQNGIFDTAAQGRAIELGAVAVYFKQKILAAPAGEVRSPAKPLGEDGKPADPASPAATPGAATSK